MKNRVFSAHSEYVGFMLTLPMDVLCVHCTNYLPSCVFPKHLIDRYFEHWDHQADHKVLAEQLWEHGKHVRKAARSGRYRLFIEEKAISDFAASGTVHSQYPSFEASFALRAAAFGLLGKLASDDAVKVLPSRVPYNCRVLEGTGVLLDIDNNVSEQLIQGLWIEDASITSAFCAEMQRLEKHPETLSGNQLVTRLATCEQYAGDGYPVQWNEI